LAVELRLGEKSARQPQNLVGFAQLPNFALRCFYPVALGAGHAIAHARVDLVFTDPIMQSLWNTADRGAMIQWLPTRTDTRYGVQTPCAPHVRVLRGKTCLISSWPHSLRCWSLLKTRGDSIRTRDGKYLGDASANRFDPNSLSNPFGRHGNPMNRDSINNPGGALRQRVQRRFS